MKWRGSHCTYTGLEVDRAERERERERQEANQRGHACARNTVERDSRPNLSEV